MRNIVLIGMPGGGKTEIGRATANELGRPFIDIDEIIERKSGMSISDIFERYGEAHFRKLESDAVIGASSESGAIIATGGGVVLLGRNMETLSLNGLIIYIERPIENIISSIDTSFRPLLQKGPDRILNLFAEREALYRQYADETLVNNAHFQEAVDGLIRIAKRNDLSGGYAVIGDPISHSLSPSIHNAVFDALCFEHYYGAVRVRKGNIGAFVKQFRDYIGCGAKGFNVTMPHKTDIIPLLDGVSKEAELCASVNTVTVSGSKLFGHNTDMEGLSLALLRRGYTFAKRNVLILGAGGVANTVAVKAAIDAAASITVSARTPDRAIPILERAIGASVKLEQNSPVTSYGDMSERFLTCAENADIIINTTPLGMTGISDDFISLEFLKYAPKYALICDLIYSPPKTKLLYEAEAIGLKTQNGLPMLIYQALIADKLFIESAGGKCDFDIEIMFDKINNPLKGEEEK